MSTVMTTGVMPDHRERSAAVRSRGVSSTVTAERVETTTPPPMKEGIHTVPQREPVENLSQTTDAPELQRNLSELMTREQTKRDRAREEELARIRELQTRD